MIRRAALEKVLHKGLWAYMLDVDRPGGHGYWNASKLLRLPAGLDAVVNKGHEASGDDHIGDVGDGIENAAVTDPHVAWGHPATGTFILNDLVWRSCLGDNVRNGIAGVVVAVFYEVERDNTEVLVSDTLPLVFVAPPVKLVALVVGTAAA